MPNQFNKSGLSISKLSSNLLADKIEIRPWTNSIEVQVFIIGCVDYKGQNIGISRLAKIPTEMFNGRPIIT